MKTTFLIFILLCFTSSWSTLLGQEYKFSGQIIDANSNAALSYVNIGVVGENIGTVSDRSGKFSLSVPLSLDTNIIRISMVGYKTQNYSAAEFDAVLHEHYNHIALVPENLMIPTIAITDKKMQSKLLGNKTRSKIMGAGFASHKLGNEMGLKIKVRKKPSIIKDFNVSIRNNSYDTLRFRLNFYDLKRGRPGDKLVQKDIIIETTIESGILTVDLGEYNIVVNDHFFVSMEWIENLGEGDLDFSASMFSRSMYYRTTSHAKWRSIKTVGVGMNVTVLY